MKKTALVLFLLLSSIPVRAVAQPFVFQVRHEHLWGSCTGALTLDDAGVAYSTKHAEHARQWSFTDLKRVEIVSRTRLDFLTYEDRKYRPWTEREFEFNLLEGEVNEAVYRLLLRNSTRPVVSRMQFPDPEVVFNVRVKHRHLLGGCEGDLVAHKDALVYRTEHTDHARIWPYKDIASVGLESPYQLRVTTLLENYTFDLKTALTPAQYDFLWARVYRLEELYPGAGGKKDVPDAASPVRSGLRPLCLRGALAAGGRSACGRRTEHM